MAPEGQLATFKIIEKENNYTDLGSVIKRYLYHWPLYLTSLALLITGAIVYLLITPPTYEVNFSLIIKNKTQDQNQQSSALQEINLDNSSKIIENEIEILKSKKLITTVISDLKLWINYQMSDNFKRIDLYKKSPINFTLIGQSNKTPEYKLDLVIIDSTQFDLLMPEGKYRRFSFKNIYDTKIGRWKIELNDNIEKYKGKNITVIVSDPESVALNYQESLEAGLLSKMSSAVILTIDDQVPERGVDFLNDLVKNYNLSSSNEKNEDINKTLAFLDQKIEALSGELKEAEKGIENFKSSKALTDISMQSQVSLQNLQTNDNKLNDANIQLNTINSIETYINSNQNSWKVPSANGISDAALVNLIEKLSQLQLQYVELASTTPETSPEFESINSQIKTTKSAIKESVRNIKSSLKGTRDKLKSYNSDFESSIRNIPAQERQYISIKREQASKEELYTYYLQKREEVAASYSATLKDDKVIDKAYYGKPKSPKKAFTYAFAILFGFLLPTAILYVRNVLNTKIMSVKEIKDALKNLIVAELPFEEDRNPIVVNNKYTNAASEQFRMLRAKLNYLHNKKETGRVTLITSSVPGEGKSFVSANLALALAYVGRKTVILELDMRKPKIASVFNLPKSLGLSDYFMSNASLEDILQESKDTANLTIIASGSEISNPSELLERPLLQNLIEKLKQKYDDIVIDSPPAHLVSDAIIVSQKTDVCLYIIRQGVTDKSELPFIKDLVEQNQIANASIIFNGLDQAKNGYGYNYNNSYYTIQTKRSMGALFKGFFKRF